MFAKCKVFRAGFSLSRRFFSFFFATARPFTRLDPFPRPSRKFAATESGFASSVPFALSQLRGITDKSEQV
jgi:hypothetical protein